MLGNDLSEEVKGEGPLYVDDVRQRSSIVELGKERLKGYGGESYLVKGNKGAPRR